MSIRTFVEWVEIWRCSPGERALIQKAYRFRSDKVKIQVLYVESTSHRFAVTVHNGNGFFSAHERNPALGDFATSTVYGKGPKAVLFRLVPRPLCLRDAVRFDEIEYGVARAYADMLMDRGNPEGAVVAKMLYAKREDAA